MVQTRDPNYYVEISLSQMILFSPLMFFGFIMGHPLTIIYCFVVIIISAFYPIVFGKNKFDFLSGTKFCTISTLILFTVMTILYGWQAGYYLYLFEVLSLISMNSFLDELKRKQKSNFSTIFITVILVLAFLLLKIYSLYFEPYYELTEKLTNFVFIANGLVVILTVPMFAARYRKQIGRSIDTLKSNALLDELTGLFNRRAIRPYLDLYMTEFNTKGINFGIAIFDIDDFKHINDKYGHNEGDKVLTRVAEILKENITETINVARWGGEEFIVLQQYGSKDYLSFVNLIESISEKISKESFLPVRGGEYKITVTAGCSHSVHNIAIKDLINRADIRLYKGKNSGKNCTIYQ